MGDFCTGWNVSSRLCRLIPDERQHVTHQKYFNEFFLSLLNFLADKFFENFQPFTSYVIYKFVIGWYCSWNMNRNVKYHSKIVNNHCCILEWTCVNKHFYLNKDPCLHHKNQSIFCQLIKWLIISKVIRSLNYAHLSC